MSTAFVTGGSGFIGGRLISRLVSDGVRVSALARSGVAAERVASLGAEPVSGDLADVDTIAAGCSGAEVAFHAAALAGPHGSRHRFWQTNVEGTRHVIEACRRSGVRRLVHVGTEAELMAGQPLIDVDETARLRPDSPAPYPATKAAAERLVTAANSVGLQTVVVRPRFVWGPDDTTVLPQLVEMVRSGRFVWIGGGRQPTDTTHVDNVVHGLLLAADRGRPGEAYFVTDGVPVVFREFVTALLATRGVTPPDRSVPLWLARSIAGVCDRLWRVLPGDPPLQPFAVWIAGMQCTIDITKARTELGYAPVRTHADGLAELSALSS